MGAYRDTEVARQSPLSTVLADLAHGGLVTHHTLAPLSEAEAGELLDDLLPTPADRPELRARLVRRSGGVPFFLVGCARSLIQGVVTGDGDDLPWDVAQSIRQRIVALPNVARTVLEVAALIGRRVPHALLARASLCAADAVLIALEATGRARLLVEDGIGAYRFGHGMAREVVEADLSSARAATLHRRIAQAPVQEPGTPAVEDLAYHYGRSGDQENAVVYLEQAGDHVQAQGAHAAAEGYYRDAIERLDQLGRALDLARACEKLGAVLLARARYHAALEMLERAAAVYSADRARGTVGADRPGACRPG